MAVGSLAESRFAGLLKMMAGHFDELTELAKDFSMILPVKRLELTQQDENTVRFNIIGAGRRMQTTESTLEFIKGVLNAYGYTVTKQELTVGAVSLLATKRNKEWTGVSSFPKS